MRVVASLHQRRVAHVVDGRLMLRLRRRRVVGGSMASEGYHEPFELLSEQSRDLHRALVSLQEELEAMDWYQQRVEACTDAELREILAHNQREEMEHASMLIEWLRRHHDAAAAELASNVFKSGPIVSEEEQGGGEPQAAPAGAAATPRLTVGSLKGRAG